ncbi:vitamin B12 ABC transporter B12-binding component BtuF [Vibrio variabilis]|uniref:Vitamin B12 ABC transporter B12-binding component BtuF n=1 Tax=Vibrio variabilis TaxID=990271 RepID=A0ABQ0J5M3_9VIBR|nr:vitamin B12 ABC transporter B12-binding component BtuF [Vibrio variabilis]
MAVSEYSDYPEAAQKLERVANYQGIKLERIVALEPDLILAWPTGNPARELEKLEQLGFNFITLKQNHSMALPIISRRLANTRIIPK